MTIRRRVQRSVVEPQSHPQSASKATVSARTSELVVVHHARGTDVVVTTTRGRLLQQLLGRVRDRWMAISVDWGTVRIAQEAPAVRKPCKSFGHRGEATLGPGDRRVSWDHPCSALNLPRALVIILGIGRKQSGFEDTGDDRRMEGARSLFVGDPRNGTRRAELGIHARPSPPRATQGWVARLRAATASSWGTLMERFSAGRLMT